MNIFKKGPFHLTLNTGVTIVPIGVRGAFEAKNRNDWRIYPRVIKLNIGDTLNQKYYNNMSVEELRDDVRERIATLCEDDLVVAKETI